MGCRANMPCHCRACNPSTQSRVAQAASAGALELSLVARGLGLGMRCASTALRNKWVSLLSKLLRRIHAATQACLQRWHASADGAGAKSGNGALSLDPAERDSDMAGESCTNSHSWT